MLGKKDGGTIDTRTGNKANSNLFVSDYKNLKNVVLASVADLILITRDGPVFNRIA